ncbi:two-component system response regulator YesN [Paenibacillus turicensis]|uniref:Two-component system response regulator YesN n=1 Tax=Paenibacillus turicensis TaxID=160487 RepID=A0ABS4FPG0_9BACL|nr:response regulator transcription factor [Paenibacillus turicensis]MBP1904228.1 two-component system response regulator YesN [Paenibacillus turicensis]
MIKVLIVDDEPKLREGLKFFIDWESYGYLVVDTAANGYDALSKYEQHHPDLVIADIRMPGMDGIQLIKALREKDNDLHILILSGYADFDYAKKAITHRADGYLLKPVDEEELISYLETIKQAIELKEMSTQRNNTAKEYNREALITNLIEQSSYSLSKNEDQLTEDELILYDQADELGLLWPSYQILLISVQYEDESDTTTAALLRKKLADLFEKSNRGYCFTMHSLVGVLLKQPLVEVELQELYTYIAEIVTPDAAYFTAAISSKGYELREVKTCFEEAKELLRQHFILDQGNILSNQLTNQCEDQYNDQLDEQDTSEALSKIDTLTFIEKLYYAIDISNASLAAKLIHRIGQYFVTEGFNEKIIKQRFAEILNVVFTKFVQKRSEQDIKNVEFSDALAEIYEVRTLHELYEKANLIVKEMMSNIGQEGKHQEVKIMLDLIQRNYSDNLKLETLAGVFNYNSAYLGKLFKNETGEYFNTYVDKVRIEKAKDFLEQGYKVYQVAEKVGYTNVDYFHTKFRKYVGTSPSAYRKESEASS